MENNNLKFSQENQNTLMIATINEIVDAAQETVTKIKDGSLIEELNFSHMGNFVKLNSSEESLLLRLSADSQIESLLRKIIINSSTNAFFHFFNYLDNTSDPDEKFGKWSFSTIVECPEGVEVDTYDMLHDSFFANFHDWFKIKNEM